LIGLPERGRLAVAQTLPIVPLCSICGKPVVLEGSNTDSNGEAVHEECYARKLAKQNPPAREPKS